ncbi:hypothetical protein K491DRAFT_720381 [Lophiostoma macrostomum CBS 122681]|uniref:Uncharacterized protein n=1 Tax=Lophiostoma macrostomum CBS 122681 TaxID=1314788 RepID=A0A6A6STA2_9PLEO|nr:hypothetical protein K491DRAFT_720381 [Lophiostoma macrostomum CBS 122681]
MNMVLTTHAFGEAQGFLHRFLCEMLQDPILKIRLEEWKVRNIPPARRAFFDPPTSLYSYIDSSRIITRVFVSNTDQDFILDPSGAECGIIESCLETAVYKARYLLGHNEHWTLPNGTMQFIYTLVSLYVNGYPGFVTTLRWFAAYEMNKGVKNWKKRTGLTLAKLLRQPEALYRANSEALMEDIRMTLRKYRTEPLDVKLAYRMCIQVAWKWEAIHDSSAALRHAFDSVMYRYIEGWQALRPVSLDDVGHQDIQPDDFGDDEEDEMDGVDTVKDGIDSIRGDRLNSSRAPIILQGSQNDGPTKPGIPKKILKITSKTPAHARSKSDSSVGRKARFAVEVSEDRPVVKVPPNLAQSLAFLQGQDCRTSESSFTVFVQKLQKISSKREDLTQALHQLELEERKILSQMTRIVREANASARPSTSSSDFSLRASSPTQNSPRTHLSEKELHELPSHRRMNRTQSMSERMPLADIFHTQPNDEEMADTEDVTIRSRSFLPMPKPKRIGSVSKVEQTHVPCSFDELEQTSLHKETLVPTNFGSAEATNDDHPAQTIEKTPSKGLHASENDATMRGRRPATPASKRSYETPFTVARKKWNF